MDGCSAIPFNEVAHAMFKKLCRGSVMLKLSLPHMFTALA